MTRLPGAEEERLALVHLVELAWSLDLAAVEVAAAPLLTSPSTAMRVETLNALAYASLHSGSLDAAVGHLETALRIAPSYSLLLNAAFVETERHPARALAHLTAALDLEPTRALLDRALALREDEDLAVTDDLRRHLLDFLDAAADLETFLPLLREARTAAPEAVLQLEPVGPVALAQAQVQFFAGEIDQLALAQAFADASAGRPRWFEAEWRELYESVSRGVLIDVPKGIGAALVIDGIDTLAPGLMTSEQRAEVLPWAGAQIAGFAARTGRVLTDEARQRLLHDAATSATAAAVGKAAEAHLRALEPTGEGPRRGGQGRPPLRMPIRQAGEPARERNIADDLFVLARRFMTDE